MSSGLTYDTGMLVAAERNVRSAWTMHRRALAQGVLVTVPAAVLAQAWRGGPQPLLSRLLRGCVIDPLDEPVARSAGAACRSSGSSDIVDSSVVTGAASRGDAIVTSDPNDLRRIAMAIGQNIPVQAV